MEVEEVETVDQVDQWRTNFYAKLWDQFNDGYPTMTPSRTRYNTILDYLVSDIDPNHKLTQDERNWKKR